MASSSPASGAKAIPLEDLDTAVDGAVGLIQNLEDALANVFEKGSENNADDWALALSEDERAKDIDALGVARDAASLVKAHSTKLSLFIINEPFTPSAITSTLRELVRGPVPALGSAVQYCHADRYTRFARRDLAWRCSRVLKELRVLVAKIPRDGKVLSDEQKYGTKGRLAERGSITTTGVLWSACDEVIRFANLGIVGQLVEKVNQFRDTLKDVMEEMKEWSEDLEEDDGDDDADDDDEEDSLEGSGTISGRGHGHAAASSDLTGYEATQALVDSLMDAHSDARLPAGDPQRIRERLESSLRRVRLTILLTEAIVKRRLKTLPALPSSTPTPVTARLDEVMPLLRKMPDRFGELAEAFYELNAADIDRLMDQCFFDAFAVSELLARSWDGKDDAFASWVTKFQAEIKKA